MEAPVRLEGEGRPDRITDPRVDAVRRLALRRLDRQAAWWQAAVLAGWFGLAGSLGAVLALVLGGAHALGVAVLAVALAVLLAPCAVRAQWAVKQELSRRRLAVGARPRGELGHLPPPLRELVLETWVVQSLVDSRPEEPAPRAIWDWLRLVERLGEAERAALASLGLSEVPVRRTFLREPHRRGEELRADLTESQRVQLARHLEHFESTLIGARSLPYR